MQLLISLWSLVGVWICESLPLFLTLADDSYWEIGVSSPIPDCKSLLMVVLALGCLCEYSILK